MTILRVITIEAHIAGVPPEILSEGWIFDVTCLLQISYVAVVTIRFAVTIRKLSKIEKNLPVGTIGNRNLYSGGNRTMRRLRREERRVAGDRRPHCLRGTARPGSMAGLE
jgi:hypothetical protein